MATMLTRAVVFLVAIAVSPPGMAQIPDEFRNLQLHPQDISRDELIDIMRHFSFALDVRCQHCHVGGDGISFEGVEFHKDGPTKERARFMIRMTRNLNDEVLSQLPGDEPALRIQCKTCHRGRSKPMLLTQEMRLALDENDGVEAAVARYRELRESSANAGAFDFREWEVNTLAEQLAREDCPGDAIAIYELNQEFFPESVSIAMTLGGLYESVDDTEGRYSQLPAGARRRSRP